MTTRCTRCLLPEHISRCHLRQTRASAITALTYEKPEPLGEELLLEKIRSKQGADYDCVAGHQRRQGQLVRGLSRQEEVRAARVGRLLRLHVHGRSRSAEHQNGLRQPGARATGHQVEQQPRARLHAQPLDLARRDRARLGASALFCHYGIKATLYQTAQSRGIPFVLSGVTSSEMWWDPGTGPASWPDG